MSLHSWTTTRKDLQSMSGIFHKHNTANSFTISVTYLVESIVLRRTRHQLSTTQMATENIKFLFSRVKWPQHITTAC